VIAAEHEEVLWVFDLVREQQADGLERLLATIDVVAEKEVVGLGREPAVLEETEQIVVLAVDVTAYLGSRRQLGVRCADGSVLTLIGASSSSRMGCEMKISRALVHR
jgi:hypothetical protein